MSDTIDRRIVEMRFDNEQFEKNVSQTLITLDTLKKALEMSDAGKGFDNVTKAANRVDLSNVQNGVEQTANQFSAMEVVAITALANITNSAVNAGKRLISSFINPLFSGGKQRALNMEQAKFMFGGLTNMKTGLKYTADEIGAVGKKGTIMDNLYNAVEGTFYSLDKAALIGSQLMAAGISGTGTEITKVLKGVAGVASMFGADYQRVGDIFVKVKTQGKLMGQDLMSLNTMGVPTIATITDYLNKMGDGAKYTQEQVSDMVSKGKIDFKIFSGAMQEAFGEQASKSKQLFTGAVEDMAAAMARIGEKMWKPLIGSGGLGVNFFNAVVPVIDNINTRLTPAFTAWGNAAQALTKKLMPLIDVFGAIFDYDNTLSELKKLSSEDLKDVEGNYLVDPERVKILEKNKELIDKIKAPLLALKRGLEGGVTSGSFGVFAKGLGLSDSSVTAITNIVTGVNALKNAFSSAKSVASSFVEVFKVFSSGPTSKSFEVWAKGLGLTGQEISNIKDIIAGVTSVFNIFKTAISTVVEAITSGFSKAASSFADNTGTMRKILDLLLAIFAAIGRALSAIETPFKSVVGLLKDFGSGLFGVFSGIAGALNQFTDSSIDVLNNLAVSFENFGEKAVPVLKQILGFGKGAIDAIFSELSGAFEKLGDVISFAGKIGFAGIVWNIAKAIMKFFKIMKEGGIMGFISKLGNLGIGEVFNETRIAMINFQNMLLVYQKVLNAHALGIIATAILELAIAMNMLSKIEPARLATATAAISGLFGCLIGATRLMKPVAVKGLISIAISIRILAGALAKIGELDTAALIKGLIGVGVLLGMFTLVIMKLSTLNTTLEKIKMGPFKSITQSSTLMPMVLAIIGMALAIKMLADPIATLGSLDLASLAKGVGAVALLMGGLVGALILMSKYLDVSNGGGLMSFLGARQQLYSLLFTIIFLAAGINLLVKPVKDLGSMDVESLEKGLGSIGILLAEIVSFMTFFDMLQIEKPSSLLAVGAMMVLLGAAIKAMVGPIKEFAKMKPMELVKGLGSLAILLLECFGFMAALNAVSMTGGNMLASAGSLVIMAVGVKVLASALSDLAGIENVGQGLSALFGSLLILGAAMILLQNAIGGAAALLLAAAALAILVPPVALLSSLNFGGVVAGLGALALTLLLFAGAAVVLEALIVPMLLLAGAMAALGVGVLALGAGLTLLAGAFMMGLEPIMTGIEQLSTLIPTVCENLAQGLMSMLKVFADNADQIGEFFGKLWDGILKVFSERIPEFIDVAMLLVASLLVAINDNIYQFTIMGVEIVVNFLNGVAEKIDDVIDAGFNLVAQFLFGVSNAIAERGGEIVVAINDILLAILEVLAGTIPLFGKQAADAIASYRDELKAGLTDPKEVNGLREDSGKIQKTIEEESKPDAGKAKQSTTQFMNGMNSGLQSGIPSLRAKANEIADIVDDVIRKKNLIASPSKRLMHTGEFMMMGLIAGIDNLTSDYQNRATSISTMMIDAFDSTSSEVGNIRPVIDPIFGSADLTQLTASVNLGLDNRAREERALADNISSLTKSLNGMTESMNSRSLNVYNTIDGSSDPEAFADGLIRSFRLNARTV